VALPEFDPETGYLPPGIHAVDWAEFQTRFGWNANRHRLLEQLEAALLLLRAAGCSRAWVNGSFTTAKEEPEDVDVLYEAHGVRPLNLDPLFRDEKRDTRNQRKAKFGGDFLAIFEDDVDNSLFGLFQSDRSGIVKGITTIQLSSIEKEKKP
jgi:hypothetical protein